MPVNNLRTWYLIWTLVWSFFCRRHESGFEEPYEPVVMPLSKVDWSHEPLLRLTDCDLPQPREWTLAEIGQEVRPLPLSRWEAAGCTHFVHGRSRMTLQ